MLFYKKQDPEKAEALRNMVEYCLTDGQKMAEQMGYIPLPEAVVEQGPRADPEHRLDLRLRPRCGRRAGRRGGPSLRFALRPRRGA